MSHPLLAYRICAQSLFDLGNDLHPSRFAEKLREAGVGRRKYEPTGHVCLGFFALPFFDESELVLVTQIDELVIRMHPSSLRVARQSFRELV